MRASSAVSGPSPVPSRSIAVTRKSRTPASVSDRTKASAATPVSSSQPAARTVPSRTSAATATRAASRRQPPDQLRLRRRQRAHQHACHPQLERLQERTFVADAAAHLHGHAGAAHQPPDRIGMGTRPDAVAGGGKVDHVQQGRALFRVAGRHPVRIDGVLRRPGRSRPCRSRTT